MSWRLYYYYCRGSNIEYAFEVSEAEDLGVEIVDDGVGVDEEEGVLLLLLRSLK